MILYDCELGLTIMDDINGEILNTCSDCIDCPFVYKNPLCLTCLTTTLR